MTEQQQAFLQSLRAGTDEQHKKLEQTKISQQLMDPAVTREKYALYLSAMRNVMAWAEENIFPVIDPVISKNGREKLAALDEDLTKLDAKKHAGNYTVNIDTKDLPSALGAMYVLEGSTLGGRVILKHLAQALQIDENSGARFFYGYGAETGKMWTGFLTAFTQYAVDQHAEERIIAAAKETFDSIYRYFNYI